MKTSNKQHSKLSNIKMICLVSTVVLLAGLTIFLSIATFGLFQLNQKIKITTDQPFRVSQQVNEIQASLSKMATYSERFLSEHNQAAIDEFRPAYGELYAKIKLTTDKLRKIFKGPEVDIDNFVSSCLQTYEAQMNAFSYSEDAIVKDDPWDRPDTDAYHNRIKRTHTEKLIPGYVATNKNLDIILSYAQVEQNEAVRYSDKLMKTTTTWAIIIVFCVSAGLVLFQYIIRRTSRQLAIKTRQFDTLSHTIDETFFIFDENSVKTDFVAPNSKKVLGIDFEELKQDRKIIYNYVDEESKQKILAAIKAGDCSETRELIVAYNNPMTSEKRYILMRFYRTLQDNKLKQIVSMMDRTDEIMSQKALQDALITANNANNAKRDFLSRMSHEIRTPMNAIIGMTTIAAASIEDKNKVEDCLSKINYSSKHLLGLINDVLDMSRIESNKLSINNEPFELFEFINSFISIIYPQADQKKIKFSEKMIGFNDNTIYIGDVLRLNQILLNLTSNAMKFTPAGGTITLEISKIPISSHKDTIRFVLTDSGIGMDDDAIRRLYEPFEQADSTISQKYGGTGLGMSITKNLVTLMSGFIDVKSKVDCGTRCTVDIPLEKGEAELIKEQHSLLEPLNVLVVDDEEDVCEHTVLLLEKINMRAKMALSGQEAIELVKKAQLDKDEFDICFIDWLMPNMSGIETTRQIRACIGPDKPIIIISAYDWADIEEEARKAGVNAFISKPLFISSLYNTLVNVTNGNIAKTNYVKVEQANLIGGKNILVAEDNELNLEIAQALLQMNGAVVTAATNGKEALDIFSNSAPNYFSAILMDVQMPIMGGYDATKNIRALTRTDAQTIPIIATTANAFSEDVSAALACGMNAHISKPIDANKLCEMLAKFINN